MIKKRKTKNGKSRYQARILVNGDPLYQTCDTLKQAQEWENEIRYKRDRNLNIQTSPVSIEMMFEAYLSFAASKGRGSNTLRAAKQRFHAYIKPFFHGFDMRTVEINEIEQFLKICRERGMGGRTNPLSAATCNRIRSLLAVFYAVSVKKRYFNGAFTINPFDAIEPMIEERPPIVYWTLEEKEKALKANRNSHYYPFLLTCLFTGLRVGEAVAMSEQQIDRTIHLLTIDRQYNESEKRVVFTTKGRKVRHVGLTEEVGEVLYPHQGKEFLFSRPDGAPLLPNYVRQFVMPELCERAGVKDIGPHGLRHTFSAHYLMNGGTLWDLSKILGHSTVKITESYYAHFDLEHVRRRMKVVARRGNVIQANFAGGGGTGGGA